MPRVRVGPLPTWMPTDRLLGGSDWDIEQTEEGVVVSAERSREDASDVLARLRGLAFGGLDLHVVVRPSLKRTVVRDGRTRDARARRSTTPGFDLPGTRLDEEGRFSLTPAALAERLGRAARGQHVLDLTCGAGGNAIGFARAGCRVTAVERDRQRLELARHNARIYGVRGSITFIHGDALDHAHDPAELVFVDPPWGEVDKRRTTLEGLPLLPELLERLPNERPLWLKLPPSFDPSTLPFEARVEPVFGLAAGDRHRVKFLLIRRSP